MGWLFIISFSEGSSLVKVVSEFSIRASHLVFASFVLTPVVGNSIVNLSHMLDAELFTLRQFFALGSQLGSEGILQSISDGGFSILFSLGFLILFTKVVVVNFVAIQLHRVVVIRHEFVVSVKLVSHSPLASMLDEFNRSFASEGDLESSPKFHLESDFHILVAVEILLAST